MRLDDGTGIWFAARERPSELCLADLDVRPAGTGAGTRAIEAIRSYVNARQLTLRVIDVHQPRLLRPFPWLQPRPPASTRTAGRSSTTCSADPSAPAAPTSRPCALALLQRCV